jgi:hypothetical protein
VNARLALLLAVALGVVGWWRSPYSPREQHAPAPIAAANGAPACRPPPFARDIDAPLQSDAPRDVVPIRLQPATLTPLAGFQLDARVLSRRDYASGRESELSPTDLALGWGRMRDDGVVEALDISQSGRWYFYRWQDAPPIPPAEIVRSSANMHFIAADDAVARTLGQVRAGDRVRVDGWLVEARAPDGWTWRSSLSREDSGEGACELVYVCSLRRL